MSLWKTALKTNVDHVIKHTPDMPVLRDVTLLGLQRICLHLVHRLRFRLDILFVSGSNMGLTEKRDWASELQCRDPHADAECSYVCWWFIRRVWWWVADIFLKQWRRGIRTALTLQIKRGWSLHKGTVRVRKENERQSEDLMLTVYVCGYA